MSKSVRITTIVESYEDGVPTGKTNYTTEVNIPTMRSGEKFVLSQDNLDRVLENHSEYISRVVPETIDSIQ